MTSDAAYWGKRREQLLAQMESDEAKLKKKLSKLYADEGRRLEKEIAAYYAEFGEENVLKYRQLLQTMPEADARLLIERMDEFAKKYPQYANLLPVRESIYKLNELEGLQQSVLMRQLEIGAVEQGEIDAHLKKQAKRGANYAAEQMGFGKEFYSMNSNVVKATVGASWAEGGNFSERIWGNRKKLAGYINDDLAKGFARGESYERLTKQVRERFENVSKRDAFRLVYTEGTFVFNEAQAKAHEEDFETYRIVCADSGACDVCKALQREQADEPARIKDRNPGANFPPLHAMCRCSYVVADDLDAWLAKKVARIGSSNSDAKNIPDESIYALGGTPEAKKKKTILKRKHLGGKSLGEFMEGNPTRDELAAALERLSKKKAITYEKPLSNFMDKDGERDLFAHLALYAAGFAVVALQESHEDNIKNIDLRIDGELWEVKSPNGTSRRAVESNVRSAKRQFDGTEESKNSVRVVFNGKYFAISDDEIAELLKREMVRHEITEVIQIMKDGSVRTIAI